MNWILHWRLGIHTADASGRLSAIAPGAHRTDNVAIFVATGFVYEALTPIRKDCSRIIKKHRAHWRDQADSHWHQLTKMLASEAVMENRHGFESRAQTARTDHHWRLRDHQHRSARPPVDRGRQHSDLARERYSHAGNGRYSGQTRLSGGAVDVHLAGPTGQSRHLFQSGARYRYCRAECVADHRGYQQPYPERRAISGAKGSQEARGL